MAILAISGLFIVAFCAAYIHREHPVYVWDYAHYWTLYQHYGASLAIDPLRAFKSLLVEIDTLDYNPLGVIPLFPFYELFGGGRLPYVAAVALLYLLPTAVLATWLARRNIDARGANELWLFVIALTFVPFWTPTLRGMVDISGTLFIGLATLLLFRTDFLRSRPVHYGLLLGFLLWMPFLLRRWYAYSIVIFFAAAVIVGMAKTVIEKKSRSAIYNLISALTIAGCVLLALIALFQKDLAVRILSTSYADIYDAYQLPLEKHFEMLIGHFSLYAALFSAIGAAVAIRQRKFEVVFCLIAAVGTFLFFIRTQRLGIHHYLPVAFWIFPVLATGMWWCSRAFAFLPHPLRLLPFSLASAVILLAAVAPVSRQPGWVPRLAIPQGNAAPLHIDNFEEYRRLVGDLAALTRDGSRFVVYASSLNLSDSLVTALEPALAKSVIYTPHIAKVAFFNFDALRADFAVAITPPQEHLAPGSQANVTVPGQWLLEGRGFGRAYERIPGHAYDLADGSQAFLFRRTRPVNLEEIGELVAMLDSHYPGWGEKFRSSMNARFAARTQALGDQWGQVIITGDDKVLIHPGTTLPTTLTVPLNGAGFKMPRSVNLAIPQGVLTACPDADGVTVTVSGDGAILWQGDVLPGGEADVDISPGHRDLSIQVASRARPNCDHLIATFLF